MNCSSATDSTNGLQILVVDDDPDYHLLIEDVLTDTGLQYNALFAENVSSAIQLIETDQPIDVILVDYMIRPDTGFDLFAFIENRNIKIPCIFLTNYDSPELDQKAVTAGVSDLIAKRDLKAGILKRSILYSIRDMQQQTQLEYLAHYDQLTKLVNRSLFFDRLETACRYADRGENADFAVLYIDLDFFKTINDTYGHSIGDQVLLKFAERLKEHIRESDTTARIAGDEFGVLLHNAKPPVAHMVAQKILNAMDSPLSIGDHRIPLTISIGIATTEVSGTSATKLIMDADQALYTAKKSGRKSYCHLSHAMSKGLQLQFIGRDELEQALASSQFALHYQPQFRTVDMQLTGFETLVRWHHPTRGLLTPEAFLEYVDRHGLNKEFTELTLQALFRNLSVITKKFPRTKVALNLFPNQCLDPNLQHLIKKLLIEYQIDPRQICIEITEQHLFANFERLCQSLNTLRAMGVEITLDEFGVQYSSLNLLTELPINTVKTDRRLIESAASIEKTQIMLETITNASKKLGLTSIIAGIENERHKQIALQSGCDQIQGFWCGQPKSLDQIKNQSYPEPGA